MQLKPIPILFVCLGNICRSPLAEVVVRAVAEKRGLHHYQFASAGTGDWHIGNSADPRSAAMAVKHGLDLSAHKAQQITAEKRTDWEWFIAMDRANHDNLLGMGVSPERLLLMRQFEHASNALDLPDPYYGGPDGFEIAYQMLSANAEKLLDFLENRRL
ncbi:MAG: low molecular weight protein-tyrosine-phosphatase [Mariprofundus sp.]|nr:low molecular weight protein-tyrosine-phosphatase [Mariprofundus sp.]